MRSWNVHGSHLNLEEFSVTVNSGTNIKSFSLLFPTLSDKLIGKHNRIMFSTLWEIYLWNLVIFVETMYVIENIFEIVHFFILIFLLNLFIK